MSLAHYILYAHNLKIYLCVTWINVYINNYIIIYNNNNIIFIETRQILGYKVCADIDLYNILNQLKLKLFSVTIKIIIMIN